MQTRSVQRNAAGNSDQTVKRDVRISFTPSFCLLPVSHLRYFQKHTSVHGSAVKSDCLKCGHHVVTAEQTRSPAQLAVRLSTTTERLRCSCEPISYLNIPPKSSRLNQEDRTAHSSGHATGRSVVRWARVRHRRMWCVSAVTTHVYLTAFPTNHPHDILFSLYW